MPNTYECQAYRMESYTAYVDITADSLDAAFAELERLENEGELDFQEYTGNADNAHMFTVRDEDGEGHERETVEGLRSQQAGQAWNFVELVARMNWDGEEMLDEEGEETGQQHDISNDDNHETIISLITKARELVKKIQVPHVE